MDDIPKRGSHVYVTGHQVMGVGFIDNRETDDERGVVMAEPWNNERGALDALLGGRGNYPGRERHEEILLNAGIVEDDDELAGAFLLKLTLP